ncbi:sensor domain-containing protein [Roseospira visakhapatnamensis]|uniref:Diguanylate cyclase (GGDEF)-like protein/PAS domain S-box-containing protein n=1 Tax=Roseospira visakhapatnamensis TaxID=390880 RepID=A0A7W6RBI4_9PROT|nr:EAL domain-containing protein [Roseospira visakhapatnamensis]MBB4265449.1 diguanylate cyclase (GGDEF)-like protein/PAS domain S-box-containing protein [Roseospira visakhapatnamensis]
MHGLDLPDDPLVHLDAGLGAALFVLAFLWGTRLHHGRPPEAQAARWWAAAFAVSTLEHGLAWIMGPGEGPLFLGFSMVHTLEPILLYAGLRAVQGHAGLDGPMLAMVSLGIGWVGAAMVAGLSVPLVMGPAHLLRGAVLLAVAAMAWRLTLGPDRPWAWRPGFRMLSILAVVNGVLALVAAGALWNGWRFFKVVATVEPALYGLLGLVLVVLVLRGATARGLRGAPPAWPRTVLTALDTGALEVDAGRRVVWANGAAATLFGVPEPEPLAGTPLAALLPGLDEAHKEAHGETHAEAPPAPATIHVVEGRNRRGQALTLTVRRIPAPDPADADGGHALLLVQCPEALPEHGAAGLVAMVRLFQDMNRWVRSGESRQTICRSACVLLADLTDAPLVWVATGHDRQGLTLTATAGSDGVLLAEHLGRPLMPLLRRLVAPALEDRDMPQAVALDAPNPATLIGSTETRAGAAMVVALGAREENVRADDRDADSRLQGPAVVVPMVCCGRVVGVLAVHGRSAPSDRQERLRVEAVAQHLGNTIDLARDTAFLRLQAHAITVAANATLITDHAGVIVWVNDAFVALSGFAGADVYGRTPDILVSGQQDPATQEEMWAAVRAGRAWDGEMVDRRKDGTLFTVRQTVTPLHAEDGTISNVVFVYEDITDHKRAEERVRYLSNYDTLTRLPNRTLFRDRLYQAVQHARRTQGTVAVLFVDLAQFSRVNDTMGHDVGDQILMTIGSRLNAAVAEEVDTVARMGGDEFAIIQTGRAGADLAAGLARRVARIIETPVEVGQQAVSVRANVGIAMYPDDGPDPDSLIKNADLAMYRVIRSDGETYRFYSNEMNDEAQARLALEADLRRALERRELINHYQPQYDMTGALVGMEALVRWQHPARGLISPGAFIPVAEESGLILPLGDRVLRQALADLSAWHQAGLPLVPVAVNISAAQFAQTDFAENVRSALEQHGLPPSALELELTESMLMREGEEAIRVLGQLSELGVRITIDDFGTGYSSLGYLKRFPVHTLKIDQSFVRHVHTDSNDTIIVRAIINLGHSLGMSVVAEGVETDEQFTYLRGEGADVVQGFLFSRPLPREEMECALRAAVDRPPSKGTMP